MRSRKRRNMSEWTTISKKEEIETIRNEKLNSKISQEN